ncbi:Rv3654c family TadE-like protein [Microlunatus sp. GCM10028923]|uniref:Rv3654c family TadE-like protein n=1 Tax=Microlunatus sp. GCM10028923 TaxID=3273400 RepID=UPI003612748D
MNSRRGRSRSLGEAGGTGEGPAGRRRRRRSRSPGDAVDGGNGLSASRWLPPRDERGSGTMLMVGVMIVITVLAFVGTCVAGYAVAVHQARAAADLAALSGAVARTDGGDGCATATSIARANRTTMTTCDVVGDQLDFVITIQVRRDVPPLWPGLPESVSAKAHAGPVSSPP